MTREAGGDFRLVGCPLSRETVVNERPRRYPGRSPGGGAFAGNLQASYREQNRGSLEGPFKGNDTLKGEYVKKGGYRQYAPRYVRN